MVTHVVRMIVYLLGTTVRVNDGKVLGLLLGTDDATDHDVLLGRADGEVLGLKLKATVGTVAVGLSLE